MINIITWLSYSGTILQLVLAVGLVALPKLAFASVETSQFINKKKKKINIKP